MSSMDKLFLWGAAALMAAVGSLSLWKTSQTPRIDPGIAQLQRDHEALLKDSGVSRPDGPATYQRPETLWNPILPEPKPAHDWAAFIATKAVGAGIPRPMEDVFVLPVGATEQATADLNGVTVTWTVTEPVFEKLYWMNVKPSKVAGFVIQRQCEDGQVETLGTVGPQVRSYTDLSAEPRLTYRYWVLATGQESDVTARPVALKSVTKGSNVSAEARTPAATRVKLVGGDKSNGILRVETYDRAQKKWVGKLVQAAPGRAIGASGWTLKGLRFDNFTLVADLTDDEGVDRVVTTKN